MPYIPVSVSYVPPEGSKEAKIAIVGEAPGADEDKQKRPFVGAAGGVLDTCLHIAGIVRSRIYLTNLVKEKPPKNSIAPYYTDKRGLTEKGREAQKALVEELNEVDANVIITLGNSATFALTGQAQILKRRGSILPSAEGLFPTTRKIIPTIHPAASLRGKYLYRYYIANDLKRAKLQSEFPDIRRRPCRLVVNMTFTEALAWIAYYEKKELYACDIEVVNHEISCISFCAEPSLAVSIPFYRHWTVEEEMVLWRALSKLLGNDARKIFQNAMFDVSFMLRRNHIFTWGRLEDTMIAQHIMYPDFPKGLDFITSLYTEEPYYKDEGKEWRNPSNWEDFRRYNAKDSLVTYEAFIALEKELDATGHRASYDFTIDLLEPLLAMTSRGILANRQALADARAKAAKEEAELQAELDKIVGHPLNVNSPKQCQKYFYIDKGIPPYTKSVKKDGVYESRITTDDKAMQRLARGTAARAGLREAKLVQGIRSLSKLRSTYLEITFDEDDRMRCSYNPRGTVSGRLSSSKDIFGNGTNMQNLPASFKGFLVADPGYVMIEVDKRQAEWVVVAYDSGDANMLKVIKEGLDPHTYTAHLMTGIPEELIKAESKVVGHETDALAIATLRKKNFTEDAWRSFNEAAFLPRTMSIRQCGKKSNHGLNYDEGYKTFALINEIQEKEAKFMVDRYHQVYPGIRMWHKQIQAQLENNRTLINPFNRKRRFLNIWGNDLFKAAYAHIPQSTVSDLLNRGIIATYNDSSPHMASVEALAQVHDSILFQVPITEMPHIGKIVHQIKEYLEPTMVCHGRSFTIETDMKIGLNWGDMVEVDYATVERETQSNFIRAYKTL